MKSKMSVFTLGDGGMMMATEVDGRQRRAIAREKLEILRQYPFLYAFWQNQHPQDRHERIKAYRPDDFFRDLMQGRNSGLEVSVWHDNDSRRLPHRAIDQAALQPRYPSWAAAILGMYEGMKPMQIRNVIVRFSYCYAPEIASRGAEFASRYQCMLIFRPPCMQTALNPLLSEYVTG